MERLSFVKYQGTGNDFILVDDWEKRWSGQLREKHIRALCDRHWGIGADGLMFLQPDTKVDYRMVYYNADGKESTLCGNGSRCLAHFARSLGRIGEKATFRAIDGLHKVVFAEDGLIELEMGPVEKLKRTGADWEIDTGSPHYVKYVDQVDLIPVVEWGRTIRNQPTFRKDGVNVNFVERLKYGIKVRTYERGVEDETLSCGTGVTACALSFATQLKEDRSEIAVQTRGGELKVRYEKKGDGFINVWLCGPAFKVFDGEIIPARIIQLL